MSLLSTAQRAFPPTLRSGFKIQACPVSCAAATWPMLRLTSETHDLPFSRLCSRLSDHASDAVDIVRVKATQPRLLKAISVELPDVLRKDLIAPHAVNARRSVCALFEQQVEFVIEMSDKGSHGDAR
jgi:hypothetical protein